MNEDPNERIAAELLQELGFKEYEARCFVALSRRPQGTAKAISDISEVPRTRVYDAIKALETEGLVEVQHSSPKQFRAVSIDEAIGTIRAEYEERTEALRTALRNLDRIDDTGEAEVTHEVWSLSGSASIDGRVGQLIDEATEEVIIVSRHGSVFSEELLDRLRTASDRGVDVVVGTWDESIRERIEADLPDAEVFVSGIEVLTESPFPDDETDLGRLLLVDQSAILVSSFTGDDDAHERAVFGRGFDNGLVAVVRRLMATGFTDGIVAEE
ncbi:TrmB family transcriptional regulator [Haloplanus rubicundus]|uniref:TrmB family transcriptional regulator n=1 Tax=Haloplanus rubicundus TaxID=1547898 RepID=UPI0016571BA0|nr:helix-turn-helix domain-containing protein [Haloplanus rubicundus]